jgi:hypothetical protein
MLVDGRGESFLAPTAACICNQACEAHFCVSSPPPESVEAQMHEVSEHTRRVYGENHDKTLRSRHCFVIEKSWNGLRKVGDGEVARPG